MGWRGRPGSDFIRWERDAVEKSIEREWRWSRRWAATWIRARCRLCRLLRLVWGRRGRRIRQVREKIFYAVEEIIVGAVAVGASHERNSCEKERNLKGGRYELFHKFIR
jgi:hypothetical protein